jgi:hypothetical protein
MIDYVAYRRHVGIENADMTRTIHGMFPKYDKVVASYLNHPEKRGVCLLPEAEELLVRIYGPGPGLQSIPFGDPDQQEEQKPKKSTKRRKSNAITFRMDDETYRKALDVKEAAGCMSMQELFELLLKRAIKEMDEVNRMEEDAE